MHAIDKGYFHCVAALSGPARYFYLLDRKKKRPDPASKFQPEGVHGPSQVCLDSFRWTDSNWTGLPLTEAIFYELHVGTFTPEGTLDAIINRLPALKTLGITLIELMPLAQFPGDRNWGYDGVYPYAVQNSYGGPNALKRLVNACHNAEIGVTLDVVYNHLGPEGNYLNDFGPYFTDHYKTPWGNAINFDDAHSDEVRRFFLENALYWITEFHIDALRLDAVHAILDISAKRFLEELTERVADCSLQLGRKIHLIAENDRNDARSLAPREAGGFGFDSQWNDDFHHSIHALVTGERRGYYGDFGTIKELAKAYDEGFVYSGQYSAFRRRRHGTSSAATPCYQFVVFSQDHDQVGNRPNGERMSQLVCFETLKLVAGAVILSPFIPLLFMGEEYAEVTPFQYFISHGDSELVDRVREGRRRESEQFAWQGDIPDPASANTFLHSKLHWEDRNEGQHRVLLLFYTELLKLRKRLPALSDPSKENTRVSVFEPEALIVERWNEADRAVIFFNFGAVPALIRYSLPAGVWEKQIDSAEEKWNGSCSPIPALLDATKGISLEVQPRSFTLFQLRRGDAD